MANLSKLSRVQRQKLSKDEIQEGDILFMLHVFSSKCPYCNVDLVRTPGYDNSLELDHYISLSEQDTGDTYQLFVGLTLQNTLPACRECNRNKYNFNPEEWINQRFINAKEVLDRIDMYFAQIQENIYV